MIFQKFVAVSKGRDLRVFIVDGEVLACMERRAKEGDFKANYSQGGSVRKYDLDEDTRKLALKTAEVLGLQVAGIDLLFKEEGGFTICEANTFPGFKGLEQACGVNVPEAIFKSMQRDLKRGHMRVDSTTIAPKQKRSGWKLILTGIRHLVDGVFGKIKGAVAQS
ncbi:MAG: RimK family alpha-L-glutamate ligase [Pseudobdellovibrionaceae bacterium]